MRLLSLYDAVPLREDWNLRVFCDNIDPLGINLVFKVFIGHVYLMTGGHVVLDHPVTQIPELYRVILQDLTVKQVDNLDIDCVYF